jgi:hypothetical protein
MIYFHEFLSWGSYIIYIPPVEDASTGPSLSSWLIPGTFKEYAE